MTSSLTVTILSLVVIFAWFANAKPHRHVSKDGKQYHFYPGMKHTCEFHGICNQPDQSPVNPTRPPIRHTCEFHGTCGPTTQRAVQVKPPTTTKTTVRPVTSRPESGEELINANLAKVSKPEKILSTPSRMIEYDIDIRNEYK
jgi:hypothetical protein